MTELSQKADIALADLTANGGLLLPEQNDVFIRKLIDTPTMLNSIRVYPMNAPQAYINRIGFGSRILRAARQAGGAEDSGANDRYVLKADRASPQTNKIQLKTNEVIAEVRIPYEVLEDNIERGDMVNTILALIAERAALDLEELILLGDTGSADPYLALTDGVIKKCSMNIYDASGEPISADVFNEAKKQIPTAYRRNLQAMRYFVHPDVEADYRLKIASRNGGLGDAVLTGAAPLPVLGSPLAGAALMPTSNILYANPQNIIFGVQRNIRIEQDRDIRSREVVIVLTARVDVQIEQQEAVSKVVNLG